MKSTFHDATFHSVPGALAAMLSLVVAGCSSGSGGGEEPPAAPPPPVTTTTPFTPFVKEQIQLTSDTSEPTAVNEKEWAFDEEETAYDDLLNVARTPQQP